MKPEILSPCCFTLFHANADFLFMVEGMGQGNIGANWGDGFATGAVVAQQGLSNPGPFFDKLINPKAPAPYRNNVIISPHVYPPSVTHESMLSRLVPPGYFTRLSLSFGYLTKKGYCNFGVCQRFPVVIGEFGSRLSDCRNGCAGGRLHRQRAQGTDRRGITTCSCALPCSSQCLGCLGRAKEVVCPLRFGARGISMQNMAALVQYINAEGGGNDGLHEAIEHWMWWDWNANSGDTGGVVSHPGFCTHASSHTACLPLAVEIGAAP